MLLCRITNGKGATSKRTDCKRMLNWRDLILFLNCTQCSRKPSHPEADSRILTAKNFLDVREDVAVVSSDSQRDSRKIRVRKILISFAADKFHKLLVPAPKISKAFQSLNLISKDFRKLSITRIRKPFKPIWCQRILKALDCCVKKSQTANMWTWGT